jgi:5'-nucleotidase
VTNDDGVEAPGLIALASALDAVGEVAVVAPDRERSAVGHAITMTEPLRAWREEWPGGREVFAVDGTPADCVKVGVKALLKRRPDAVVSGINLGGNAGVNVIYSGTVSAATEATILGIPAAAVSLNTFTNPDFGPAARVAVWVARKILADGLPPRVMLNVNVPALPPEKIAGAKTTRQSGAALEDRYEERRDPRGRRYFWLAAERLSAPDPHDDDDVAALEQGYVSVTPIHYDLTDEAARAELARWAEEFHL